MRDDWGELTDKGPPIVEPEHKHKKKSSKKPFVIEKLFVGPASIPLTLWMEAGNETGWRVYRRYKTEKQREQAFATLLSKQQAGDFWLKKWEFRL